MLSKRDKDTWVKALRSGEYEQGRGHLCRNGSFCCLGVAFDVLADDHWILKHRHLDVWGVTDSRIGVNSSTLDGDTFLPKGLEAQDISILITMNDNGHSFSEIADYIEENL